MTFWISFKNKESALHFFADITMHRISIIEINNA